MDELSLVCHIKKHYQGDFPIFKKTRGRRQISDRERAKAVKNFLSDLRFFFFGEEKLRYSNEEAPKTPRESQTHRDIWPATNYLSDIDLKLEHSLVSSELPGSKETYSYIY